MEATGVPEERASTVRLDGADPAGIDAAIAAIVARYGRIDIVVNNAGSAGPRQPIHRLPLTDAELAALVAEGATDAETVPEALRSILGVAWHVARAAAPHIPPGGSIINISTIFSRTEYYARAAYVVPKAAMNALSRQLSFELGARGVRVNTVYPGPIRSERIESVFATMDRLKGDEQGTTGKHFTTLMSLARSMDGEAPAKVFPTPRDVAGTCVFLGSDESAAFNGHDFEITHGMWVRKESRNEWVSRPTMRVVDGHGMAVLVAAGTQVDDALGIARVQAEVGAEVVLAFAGAAEVREAKAQLTSVGVDARISVMQLDRGDAAGMETALADVTPPGVPLGGAIILPSHAPTRFAGAVSEASIADIETFLDDELAGTMGLARALTRYWGAQPVPRTPRFVMMTNDHDGGSDGWADLLRAAMEELTRVWRDETTVDARQGRRSHAAWGNQVVRYTNRERENLRFAGGQAARLLYTDRRIRPVNLYLPGSIIEATGARRAVVGQLENLTGLHMGKVALITGGSAGIGGQVARLLAMAGAKLMLCARRESELRTMRDQIVGELEDVGYSGAERRVRILAGFDVGDLDSLDRAVSATVEAFGRIDYLLNNAGVAGAEEMVVDMSVDAWRYTLDANLVSNYALLHAVVPTMRQQGSGYIVNVSSYFGGEKHLAVAYPNRSDYAVSKAGQRAIVESMARYLGPEIQVNAIAPGPVDGDRLRGVGGKPG
ncbi:MAG: SDR family NAD(P)-dependent oxidoreductase, partial [Gemmatimonadaceae bacterium]|nr:SDR family NAD(P)-dependent oxidoreductase [Gemmatimonadaceae bacterium]